MNNKTTNKLIWIGVLAVFLISTNQAFAYVPGVWDPHPRVNSNPTFTTVVSSAYTTPVQATTNNTYPSSYFNSNTQNTGTNTNNNSSNNVSSQTNNQNQVKTVATNTNRATTSTYTTSSTRTSIPQVNTVNTMGYINQSGIGGGIYPNANTNKNVNANELTALSLRGSGSFMPSSIWQWLLVVFLILVIIILSRILTRRHEVHEVHNVAHH